MICKIYLRRSRPPQNQNQKEKFESELKSQIKKLQRFRDDIKTWITNSDIKDKKPLTDARKLIETEMERFKVCEKEFKTKAFSKEGLSQAPKEDPKERERQKARDWIGSCLEKLGEQVDVYEADLEAIAGKKAKKKDAARFEELIERCRFHEEKLEILLRLIDNESLKPEDLEPVKDQLDFLLEALQDGDDTGIDDESIYEELDLEELTGGGDDEPPAPPTPTKAEPEKKLSKKEQERLRKEEEEAKKKEEEKKAKAAEPIALPSINAAALKAPPPKAKEEPAGEGVPRRRRHPAPAPAPAPPAVTTAAGPSRRRRSARRRARRRRRPRAAQPARGGRGVAEGQGLIGRAARRRRRCLPEGGGRGAEQRGGRSGGKGAAALRQACGRDAFSGGASALPTPAPRAVGGAGSAVGAAAAADDSADGSEGSGGGSGAIAQAVEPEGFPVDAEMVEAFAAALGPEPTGGAEADDQLHSLHMLSCSLQNMPDVSRRRPRTCPPLAPPPPPAPALPPSHALPPAERPLSRPPVPLAPFVRSRPTRSGRRATSPATRTPRRRPSRRRPPQSSTPRRPSRSSTPTPSSSSSTTSRGRTSSTSPRASSRSGRGATTRSTSRGSSATRSRR